MDRNIWHRTGAALHLADGPALPVYVKISSDTKYAVRAADAPQLELSTEWVILAAVSSTNGDPTTLLKGASDATAHAPKKVQHLKARALAQGAINRDVRGHETDRRNWSLSTRTEILRYLRNFDTSRTFWVRFEGRRTTNVKVIVQGGAFRFQPPGSGQAEFVTSTDDLASSLADLVKTWGPVTSMNTSRG